MSIQGQVFEAALNIEKPIYIEQIEFESAQGELHLYLDFEKGGRFKCAVCGEEHCAVHDTTDKTWRHLDFFQHKAYIHFRTPPTKCPKCGVHLYVPSWARSRSGFTLLFEAYILTLAKEMPVKAIAKIVREDDTKLWRIIKAHVEKAHSKKDFIKVQKVGVDETSTRKGHRYISVFMDMEQKTVLYATPGKDAKTIEMFSKCLQSHNADAGNIKDVSMDMSPAFISGVRKQLPNANMTFDKFHVISKLNSAMDEIRRNEVKMHPCLKGSRYLWLKNPEHLTVEEQQTLKGLSKENKRLGKAHQMKLTLQDIYRNVTDKETARFLIGKWCNWGIRSRQEPIKKFTRMVRGHLEGILNYFDSRLTNALLEGTNSRIQQIKSRAKGFRSSRYFINMIYLAGADLALPAF